MNAADCLSLVTVREGGASKESRWKGMDRFLVYGRVDLVRSVERSFGCLQENKSGEVGIMYETRITLGMRRCESTARSTTLMGTKGMDGPSRAIGVMVL